MLASAAAAARSCSAHAGRHQGWTRQGVLPPSHTPRTHGTCGRTHISDEVAKKRVRRPRAGPAGGGCRCTWADAVMAGGRVARNMLAHLLNLDAISPSSCRGSHRPHAAVARRPRRAAAALRARGRRSWHGCSRGGGCGGSAWLAGAACAVALTLCQAQPPLHIAGLEGALPRDHAYDVNVALLAPAGSGLQKQHSDERCFAQQCLPSALH